MKHYQINLTINGVTSPIDYVTTVLPEYTADAYIQGCRLNADEDWCKMIARGTVECIYLYED